MSTTEAAQLAATERVSENGWAPTLSAKSSIVAAPASRTGAKGTLCRGARMAPAADEGRDDGDEVDDREQLNPTRRPNNRIVSLSSTRNALPGHSGAHAERIRVDRDVHEMSDRDEHVAGHDESELPPRLQPAARVRDQQVDQEPGRDGAERDADGPGQRLVRAHEPRAHEPGEPDGDQQESGAVQRPPRARDQPGGDERAARERNEDGLQARHVPVVAEDMSAEAAAPMTTAAGATRSQRRVVRLIPGAPPEPARRDPPSR